MFEIPPGLIPEAHPTIERVKGVFDEYKRLDKEGLATEDDEGYGHGVRNLVQVMYINASSTPDEQRSILRAEAKRLINRYGKKIKEVMVPELLEALGLKDKKS